MQRRFGPWPIVTLLLSIAIAGVGRPVAADPGAEICERAIVAGARAVGVPPEVLHAISLTETGRPDGGRLRPWPWAINREGQGHWFKSRDEAFAFATASVAANRPSFDVGCFQINYYWHGRNFPSLETMFDPVAGATYAARFLKSLYLERGSWLAAAGAYHSQSPDRASVYRARFERILAGIGGNADLAVAAASPAPAAVTEAPRKSRTRLSRGPKIITVPSKAAPIETGGATEARVILPHRAGTAALTL
ncbi:MAG TPA: lytic transglycosylase domain-containing protein [Amaricoccus sp.]|nr:lytic transglycosylase domain-containing protein [Amaricoccus sp.]